MKTPAIVVSVVALAVTIMPSVLYFAGTINHDAVRWIALGGTIGWFVATPLWMGLPRDDSASENT